MPEVRAAIDAIDDALIDLLARRARYIDRAAELKSDAHWPARIDSRVEEVAMNARDRAAAAGLDPDFIEHLWRQLIEWSISREEELLGPAASGG